MIWIKLFVILFLTDGVGDDDDHDPYADAKERCGRAECVGVLPDQCLEEIVKQGG